MFRDPFLAYDHHNPPQPPTTTLHTAGTTAPSSTPSSPAVGGDIVAERAEHEDSTACRAHGKHTGLMEAGIFFFSSCFFSSQNHKRLSTCCAAGFTKTTAAYWGWWPVAQQRSGRHNTKIKTEHKHGDTLRAHTRTPTSWQQPTTNSQHQTSFVRLSILTNPTPSHGNVCVTRTTSSPVAIRRARGCRCTHRGGRKAAHCGSGARGTHASGSHGTSG